ncbi:MAG: sulfatase [Planctomycetota bacterium]
MTTFRVALALLAPLLVTCGREPQRPNVILITLDTTRADYLSCYGAEWATTPALDDLARGGTRFERAYSSSSLTPVSHATILTGRVNPHHGLRVLSAGSGYRLSSDTETLATRFQAAGYTTAAVHSAFPVSRHFGFDRGFDHFDDLSGNLERAEGADKTQWDVDTLQRRSDDAIDRTLAWMKGAEQPFFLWLHLWDPHDKLRLPPNEVLRVARGRAAAAGLTSPDDQIYAAEVSYQDSQLARLFAGLAAGGLEPRTVVAVTADHGQGLSDGQRLHGWAMHRMVYREQLHVPLILRGPGVQAGAVIQAQVRTADIAPTLLELANLAAPLDPAHEPDPMLDGASLVALYRAKGEGPSADRVVYADQVNGYDHNAGMRLTRPEAAFLYSLSDGAWKVIFRPHMPERSELFHLAADPLEEHNVRGEQPKEYLRLVAELARINPWITAPFPALEVVDPSAAAALGALGYSSAGLDSDSAWWWTCPEHGEVHEERRGRHTIDGCGRILVPRTSWTDAKAATGDGDGDGDD